MIVSGEARSQATRVQHMSVRPNLVGATQTVAASFASVDNNTAPQLGVVLRYQGLSNYYRCYRSVGGVSVVRIAKLVNGKETVLKSVAMANPLKNAPFTLSCGVSGTSLTLSIDGVTKASAVDSTFASGSVGFALSSSSGTGASHRPTTSAPRYSRWDSGGASRPAVGYRRLPTRVRPRKALTRRHRRRKLLDNSAEVVSPVGSGHS
jgi:hypothetical protein